MNDRPIIFNRPKSYTVGNLADDENPIRGQGRPQKAKDFARGRIAAAADAGHGDDSGGSCWIPDQVKTRPRKS